MSPVLTELRHILNHPVAGHVIFIDDARLFRHEEGYPEFSEVFNFVAQFAPGSQIEVKDDIIRITEIRPIAALSGETVSPLGPLAAPERS